MIGNTVLGKVVGANALRAIHRADLALAEHRCLGVCLLLIAREDAGTQHAHPGLAVLELALLVLHRDNNSSRKVGNAHGRVCRIDRLATGAARTVDVNLEIVLADLDLFRLVDLRENENASSRGMDAPLRFGGRHALDAMYPSLVLEVGPDPLCRVRGVALDRELDVLDAAEVAQGLLDDFGLPLLRLGVVEVHPQQVGGEQG